MEKALWLFCIYNIILYGTACRDTIWFQASLLPNTEDLALGKIQDHIPAESQPIALLRMASQNVLDEKECVRLCYVLMAPVCGSAIFEAQNEQHGANWCQLLRKDYPCAQGRPLVAYVDTTGMPNKRKLLLHCFYCNRFAWDNPKEKVNFGNEQQFDWPREGQGTKNGADGSPQSLDLGKEGQGLGRNGRVDTAESSPRKETFTSSTIIPIRVMTFNTWISGGNVRDGIIKIARHILANDPQIVALQEMDDYTATRIHSTLISFYNQERRSDVWSHCGRNKFGSNHILTRFPITREHEPSNFLQNNGCQLRVHDKPPRYAHAWNLHLYYDDYGPYAACDNKRGTLGDLRDRLFSSEYKPNTPMQSRLHQTLRFLHSKRMKDASGTENDTKSILMVMGDFNAPSHLDWTSAAATLHCNVAYEWPVSKLMADFGFLDSFRVANTDPTRQLGFTWSPIYKTKTWSANSSLSTEPQDRIDFIYYLVGNRELSVKRSYVYKGQYETKLFPYHYENDWPSDHASVITDFELKIMP